MLRQQQRSFERKGQLIVGRSQKRKQAEYYADWNFQEGLQTTEVRFRSPGTNDSNRRRGGGPRCSVCRRCVCQESRHKLNGPFSENYGHGVRGDELRMYSDFRRLRREFGEGMTAGLVRPCSQLAAGSAVVGQLSLKTRFQGREACGAGRFRERTRVRGASFTYCPVWAEVNARADPTGACQDRQDEERCPQSPHEDSIVPGQRRPSALPRALLSRRPKEACEYLSLLGVILRHIDGNLNL